MPKNWKTYKLKEVAKLSTGFAFKSKLYENEGELRVIRGKNVTEGHLRWGDDSRHWNHSLDKLEKHLIQENDIVIGMDGSKIGKNRALVRKHDLPAILAQRVARVQVKPKLANQKFIWQLINNSPFENYVENVKTGTSIPHISLGQVGDFEITLPPLLEQKAIASILSAIDDKIENNLAMNKTLENMAMTLFNKWFFEEAEEEWKTIRLQELIQVKGGFSYKGKFIGSGDSLLLGMGCVSFNKRFLNSGARQYSGDCGINHLVNSGDLVIATRQQSDNMPILGYPAKIPISLKGRKIIVGTNLYRVINESYFSNNLLYQLLRTSLYRDHILANTKGSTVRMITKDAIELFEFKIPPKSLLTEYDEIIGILGKKIEINMMENQTLTQLRDTLLPKLISGEVRLREFEEEISAAL
tara:strand:- start:3822 stop:5060 length:1239 start_codon:yes stop_codon:yes gene_type:complete